METTYLFSVYNTENHYGYGTLTQAQQYLEQLNNDRDINLCEMEKTFLTDDEAENLGAFLLIDCLSN